MQEDIKESCLVLRSGGIILYPTDTIWGIGCDATNEAAVKKVFDIKRRTDTKAMLVLVDQPGKIQNYVNEMPEIAWDLIEMSEKPLTIIYDEARNLASNLIGKDNSIGIRVTKESFSKKLCETFRKPIVSTSANVSGKKPPENFSEIEKEIKSAVDYIVSFRKDEKINPKPSAIIKLAANGTVQIIRE
ncbi:MAG: threonylcarbamoyl-AMP synthase [Candidatus Azobacteroides sp.]|nr:threonylcarbamoyl-AMP synthase [Candidatus Azobacteroides sp.]